MVEHLPYKEEVGGSTPSPRTILFAICVSLLAGAAPLLAAEHWEGQIGCGSLVHRFAIDLDRAGGEATLDLPDQYARRYRAKSVRIDTQTFTLEFPEVLPATTLTGSVKGRRISGTWKSAQSSGPFELRRAAPPHDRLQNEEVTFRNGEITLRGTLYLPKRAARAPALVFLHGSGPQTRESYIRYFGEEFARRGIATLIYDKRRTDNPSLPFWMRGAGSFDELAEDGAAAVTFLRARQDIDSLRIGLWGLSQGAWLAPLVAAKSGDIAFLVLLSGGGVTPAEQELYDDEVKLRAGGFSAANIVRAIDLLKLADDYVRENSDARWEALQDRREEARNEKWLPLLDRFPLILPRDSPAWHGRDLDYDPRSALQKFGRPMLVILGADDALTPATLTASRIQSVAPQARIEIVPRADHGMWVKVDPHCGWAGERPAAGWTDAMVSWVKRQAQPGPALTKESRTPKRDARRHAPFGQR